MRVIQTTNPQPDYEREEHDATYGVKKVSNFVSDGDGNLVRERDLATLIETLQELNQRLAPLAGAMANTAQLRVTQTAVPSTAVTGPATSAQVVAALLTQTNSLLLSQRLEYNNLLPTLANINNATA